MSNQKDDWKEVTKEEFARFLENYPRAVLQYDCYAAGDPPLRSYNDFRGGKVWPESMVAKCFLTNDDPFYGDRKDTYYLRHE